MWCENTDIYRSYPLCCWTQTLLFNNCRVHHLYITQKTHFHIEGFSPFEFGPKYNWYLGLWHKFPDLNIFVQHFDRVISVIHNWVCPYINIPHFCLWSHIYTCQYLVINMSHNPWHWIILQFRFHSCFALLIIV